MYDLITLEDMECLLRKYLKYQEDRYRWALSFACPIMHGLPVSSNE